MATAEVVSRAGQQVAAAAHGGNSNGQLTVFDLIKQSEPAIRRALPSHFGGGGNRDEAVERFTRIALTTIRQTPKLGECTAQSMLGALMVCAQLGMEPGGPLQQAYLRPVRNHGTLEVQFVLGYRGIIELFRRSGEFRSIDAHEVCENDFFDFRYGSEKYVDHKPMIRGERGDPYAYFAVAEFQGGGTAFTVLSVNEVNKHRDRTDSKKNGVIVGPWVSDYDAMALKTCVRVLSKWLPLSPELERRIHAEGTYRRVASDLVEAGPDLPALPAGEGSGAEMGDGGLDADDGPPDPDYAPGEEPFA